MSGENNSTVVFPLPLDLVRPFLKTGPAPEPQPEHAALPAARTDIDALISAWMSVQPDAQRAGK